ncbi:hypothetical protein COLO4_22324 [Corchorus olitorius]|uniref:Uncharacterized protein n=1 Tax=Corchorus olitorius TaxID=93759 RepID=A0A1R3IMX2_9ROSI|nr:hypothetical protein COLO4_22324 [Corchorus olitorius]
MPRVQSVPPTPYITELFRLFISGAAAVAPSLLLLPALVVVPPQPFPYELGGIHINNGSALTIMTLSTLRDLQVKPAFTQVDHMMVRTSNDAPYACLLGHPWVHMAEETLLPPGQGDKFARNQEGTILAQTNVVQHKEAGEQLYRCSSRVLEADFVKKSKGDTFKAMQIMKRYGWTEGFEATTEDHQILANNGKMCKDGRTGLPCDKGTRMVIPPLSQTFRSI